MEVYASHTMEQLLFQIEEDYGKNTLVVTKQYLLNLNKLVRANERSRFLKKCKKTEIIPRFIIDKLKCFKSIESQDHPYKDNILRMKDIFSKKFLKMEIKICDFQIKKMTKEKCLLLKCLKRRINDTTIQNLNKLQNNFNQNLHDNLSKKIDKKYDKLAKDQRTLMEIDEKMFKNLTTLNIPTETMMLLSYGSKFALPITNKNQLPLIQILSEVENIIDNIDEEEKVNQRGKITNVITNFLKKPVRKTKIEKILTQAKITTDKFLKLNKNIIITKSDKGGTTVVMFKDDYHNKMIDLLNDTTTYVIVPEDPTIALNKEVKSLLTKLKNKKVIDSKTCNSLFSEDPISPRAYGLPKTHKPGIPIRPIVSTIGSPCYSKHICKILKPLTINSKYNIKNSYNLKELVDNIRLEENDVLVSFDVVSLFTNIPLALAREILIQKWSSLNLENINITEFLAIFDLCTIKSNYFQYDGKIYTQTDGLAMGNPLSPILADIVMESLFDTKLNEISKAPTIIYKYVDDIFMAIPEKMIDPLKAAFESFHPKIKFTVEKEKHDELPFLEMKLIRCGKSVITNWYHKETASNRLLNFFSSHPHQMKYNVALSFVKRVFHLSDVKFRELNKKRIRIILTKNNYPEKYIDKLIRSALYTYKNKNTNTIDGNKVIFGSLTNVQGLTDTIHNSLKSMNKKLLIAKKTHNTLASVFTSLKDPIPKSKIEGVVYSIPCECGSTYIGETGKTMDVRIKQHMNDVRLTKNKIEKEEIDAENIHGKTALVKHSINNKHSFDFKNARIIDRESHTRKRRFKEMCHIWNNSHNINYKVDTSKLHDNYTHMFNLILNEKDR